jgi:hypothetical protein
MWIVDKSNGDFCPVYRKYRNASLKTYIFFLFCAIFPIFKINLRQVSYYEI